MTETTASFDDQFAAQFEAHFNRLFRYLDRLSGEPELAADLVQEAFIKLYRRGSLPDAPGAWLISVAMNLFRNERSTQGRRRRLLTCRERVRIDDRCFWCLDTARLSCAWTDGGVITRNDSSFGTGGWVSSSRSLPSKLPEASPRVDPSLPRPVFRMTPLFSSRVSTAFVNRVHGRARSRFVGMGLPVS